MKKILVTGAGGFIGSHLVEELLKQKYRVNAFVRYNSLNRWGNLEFLVDKFKSNLSIYLGDVRDKSTLKEAFKGVDVVYHLAALISIPYSYIAPQSFLDINVGGTFNVLELSREFKVKKVFIISTSEVYGSAQYIPIDESHPKKPQSPYAASKASADLLALSYYYTYSLPIIIVRPFNNYGPRQSLRAIIPTIISQIICNFKKIKIGNIYSSRDFVFVKDTAKILIKLMEYENIIGNEINIATSNAIVIKDLINKIALKMNYEPVIEVDEIRLRPLSSEVDKLLGANKKLLNILGNFNFTSLDEGLDITIDYFKKDIKKKKEFYKIELYNI